MPSETDILIPTSQLGILAQVCFLQSPCSTTTLSMNNITNICTNILIVSLGKGMGQKASLLQFFKVIERY